MIAAHHTPQERATLRFVAGAEFITLSLDLLLAQKVRQVTGREVSPEGGSVLLGGVEFVLSGADHSLCVQEPCGRCGDPVRSLPIGEHYDVAAFQLGRHRAAHECGWLTGGK